MNKEKMREGFLMISEGFKMLADSLDDVIYQLKPNAVVAERTGEIIDMTEEEIEEAILTAESPEEVDEVEETIEHEEENEEVDNGKEYIIKPNAVVAERVKDEQTQLKKSDNTLQDVLSKLSLEELANICLNYNLSTKGKKQALIDRLITNVDDSLLKIAVKTGLYLQKETLGELISYIDEIDNEIIQSICEEEGINPDRNSLKNAILNGDIDLNKYFNFDDNTEVTEEKTEERKLSKQEKEIVESIYKELDEKKLSVNKIKKFLERYYSKDEIADLDDEELIDEYISIHLNLVDDEGVVHEFEEGYMKNGIPHCCGVPLKEVDNLYVCEVCGSEYEM